METGATVASGVLWECYQKWVRANEEVSLSRQAFAERLERRGLRRERSGHSGTRTWVGIGVREGKRLATFTC